MRSESGIVRRRTAFCGVGIFDCGTSAADHGVVRDNGAAFVAINRLDAGRRVRKRIRLCRGPLRGPTLVSIHDAVGVGNRSTVNGVLRGRRLQLRDAGCGPRSGPRQWRSVRRYQLACRQAVGSTEESAMSWTTPWSNAGVNPRCGQSRESFDGERRSAGSASSTAEHRQRTTEWSATMAQRSLPSIGLTLGGGFVSGFGYVVDHSVVQRWSRSTMRSESGIVRR